MSNENGRIPSLVNINELIPLPSSTGVINPQMYEDRMRNIQALEERVAMFKKQTEDAYNNYLHLQTVAEQGRQAERRLEELQGRYGAVGGPAPVSSLAGPSTATQFSSPHATQPSEYSEIPTSARIEEVSSVGEGSSQSASGSSLAQTYSVQSHSTQSSNTQAYAYYQQQYPQAAPYNGAGTSKANIRNVPKYLPYQQQQPYNSAMWTQSSQGMSQQYNPQAVPGSAIAPQSWKQPTGGATQSNHGHQPSGRGMGASNAAHATQPAHHGSFGAKAAHTASGQSHASSPIQQQALEHNGVAGDYEDWLFGVLQALPLPALKPVMIEICSMVDRKQQRGETKSVRETMVDENLDGRMRHICNVVSDQLKLVPRVMVHSLFRRLYDRIMAIKGQTEASATAPPNGHLGQTGSHEPLQPAFSNVPAGRHTTVMAVPTSSVDASASAASTSTSATFVSVGNSSSLANGVTRQTPVAPPPQAQSQSQSSASLVAGTSTTPALTANTSSQSTSLASAQPVSQAQSNLTHVQWYQPSDPNAPQAYRDGNGNIRFMFTPQHNHSVVHAAPSTSSSQEVPFKPSSLPQTVVPPAPATPSVGETRPEGTLSPASADRSRLAQDIIRSLGRPQGAFGTPLAQSPAPSFEVIKHPTANGKRGPSSDTDHTTPSKRQRLEQHTSKRRLLDHTPDERRPDAVVDIIPIPSDDLAGPIPTDTQSVTSSDAADVDLVQEAIFVSVPASDASGPSSPGARSPRPSSLGHGDVIASASAAPPIQSPQASSSRTPVQSPSRAKKVPLFLPSPSSSSAAPSRQTSPPPTEVDMMSDTSSVPLPRPYDRKGKGRAREDDESVIELSSRDGSPRPRSRRKNVAYVLMPPLPHYAKRLKTRHSARELSADSGSYAASESSEDELVVSDDAPISDAVSGRVDIDDDVIAVDEDVDDEDAEAAAAATESHRCLRETPCEWSGCGAALNSMATLQTHLAIHAGDKEEWGTFACQWHGCLGKKFVDKAGLLKHLRKHASVPVLCPYEGCDEMFDEADELLQHQQEQSNKHRSGRRPSYLPSATPATELRRPLSPLPGLVPAYQSVPCQVNMHPISRERHQWLGARVLENIVCFKWQGRRANAAVPSHGSRRLAERIAAAELAGGTPGGGLAYVRRLIDDEYLNFADGYSAGRHTQLYEEVPSAEVSQMVTNGLVLFAGDGDGDAAALPQPVPDGPMSTGDAAALDSHLGPTGSNECSKLRVDDSFEVSGGTAGSEAAEARGGGAGDRARADGRDQDVGEQLDAGGSPSSSGTPLVLRLPSFKYSTSAAPRSMDTETVVAPTDQLEVHAD